MVQVLLIQTCNDKTVLFTAENKNTNSSGQQKIITPQIYVVILL